MRIAIFVGLTMLMALAVSCGGNAIVGTSPTQSPVLTALPTATATPTVRVEPPSIGAFTSGEYRNLFKEMLGKSDAEIQAKLDRAWEQLFYGDDEAERVYYPDGDDMAYIVDIGNEDVRSEGMSYGMMIAVQLDKQAEFDRLWKWTKTHMYQGDGPYKGYFAWHTDTEGNKLANNPASDGEEWFVMALMFAAHRWQRGNAPVASSPAAASSQAGADKGGAIDYAAEAQAILDTMLHKGTGGLATNMFDAGTKQVVFVPSIGPESSFTDPSYHLPAYYELWARWAARDNEFWAEAAGASRAFWKTAAHPETGLMPDYANFDGTPHGKDEHADFRFDAFRTGSNVAVDYAWFAADPWEIEQSNRMLDFFYRQGIHRYVNQYTLDGKPLSTDRSPGLVAMNAVAALAATHPQAPEFVKALWDTQIPTGRWRYYDGLLYFLALLHVSGNFRIYAPN